MTGSKGQFITAFQISVSLGLTLLIGFLIYRSVPDWGQAWSVMISGRPGYLLAGIGFIMLHMLLRAMRWGILLSPVKPKISLRRLFSLTMVKYVINVIPPRAGEVAGSLLLAKKEDVSATSVIATSVLERILDLLAVLVIFGFYAAFYSHLYVPETTGGREIMLNVRGYSVKIFVLLCLGISLFAYVILHPQWINRFPAWLQRFLGRFLDGCQSLREGHALLKIGGLSIAIWLTITMQLWCMVVAYLNDFPLSGTLLLVSLTVVGVAIPTPGGVGGFQFFMNLALVNFFSPYLSGHDPYSQAAGVSNGCYVVSMIPLMVVGILCLNREGISLGRISKMSREFQTDDNDRGAAGPIRPTTELP